MSKLYLLRYNNYYNRTVKVEGNSAYDYLEYRQLGPIECNFNPNDGIDTEHIFNTSSLGDVPLIDYVLVEEGAEIVSRWFVIEATRLRGKQFRMALHRDLVADFKPKLPYVPCFVERAMLDIANPLILNSEGMSFNQIKKKEILLKDETKSGWYVGYVSNKLADVVEVALPSSTGANYPTPPIAYDDIGELAGRFDAFPNNITITVSANIAGTAKQRDLSVNTKGTLLSANDVNRQKYSKYLFQKEHSAVSDGSALASKILGQQTSVENAVSAVINTRQESQDTINTLLDMSGNVYYDLASNKIFSISLTKEGVRDWGQEITNGNLYEIVSNAAIEACDMKIGGSGANNVNIFVSSPITSYQLIIRDLTGTAGATLTIASTVNTLDDAPYKMFAIPAQRVRVHMNEGVTFSNDPQLSKNLASILPTKLGANLYDIQYLPYCPFRGAVTADGDITINDDINNVRDISISFLTTNQGLDILSYMLWCKTSNFSFNIMEKVSIPAEAISFKVEHETSFCRLVSPNYNGSFEFKPTSNYGVDYFEVSCSYKPFQPYIHINPHFSQEGLYGGDFNDQRGLVCGGDFSLPIATDNWINYQIQNASYKDAFQRQIENMETTYSINRAQMKTAGQLGVATAGISGGASGAMLGSIGGPWGAVAGGAVGGAGGALGSARGLSKDLEYADALQKEALSYTEDQFNYSLQNIRALPYSLGRVGAFTIDNKIFPFLEFYTATEQEKKALEEKIKYRGMTVGVIAPLGEFIQDERTFIQGSVIKFENVVNDVGMSFDEYHMAAALANEIHKGVYI